MGTQAEIQAAQKAEYDDLVARVTALEGGESGDDALVARVDALEQAVAELDARVTALETANPAATSKAKHG